MITKSKPSQWLGATPLEPHIWDLLIRNWKPTRKISPYTPAYYIFTGLKINRFPAY